MLLMSIAMRPLCTPPFPLERIEEMTALMGGEGRIRKCGASGDADPCTDPDAIFRLQISPMCYTE